MPTNCADSMLNEHGDGAPAIGKQSFHVWPARFCIAFGERSSSMVCCVMTASIARSTHRRTIKPTAGTVVAVSQPENALMISSRHDSEYGRQLAGVLSATMARISARRGFTVEDFTPERSAEFRPVRKPRQRQRWAKFSVVGNYLYGAP